MWNHLSLSIDRFHVTSQLFRPPYWCTAFNCVINANTTQIYNSSLLSDMDVSKCEQKSDEKPDLSCLPISDYAKKLEPLVKQRYLEKISAVGIDPVLIEGKHFEADCLPPVESTDLLFYLVLETSFYTQQQFKAFRSLEAYNQMVSGFIASVQGHIIANKFVVLAKVRHSQRMNE